MRWAEVDAAERAADQGLPLHALGGLEMEVRRHDRRDARATVQHVELDVLEAGSESAILCGDFDGVCVDLGDEFGTEMRVALNVAFENG